MENTLLTTEITQRFNIKHPILLAGMNQASNPTLAAAVTNAGGLGIIGGVGYTPVVLRRLIKELKQQLDSPDLPFGVDLLLPQVGGNARKTNKDYTKSKLPELIDIIIEEKASLFVCAVGVPPKWVVDKLHYNNIPVMNMIGSPKHVPKVLEAGVDMVCPQGYEAGGHTGEIATGVLIPQIVDLVQGCKSPLWNTQILVIAAGGIVDGRGLASALSYGASGVWVGSRFVNSVESGFTQQQKQKIIKAQSADTIRSVVYTGRPVRSLKNSYNTDYELNKQDRIKELTSKGLIPFPNDMEHRLLSSDQIVEAAPVFIGQACGMINDILPARVIIENMVDQCIQVIQKNTKFLAQQPLQPRL